MVLLLVPASNFDVFAQSEFNTTDLGLGMPKITMTPLSGQPGTEVKIVVSDMPAAPENIDPRMEFFAYLPFLSALGSNVPDNCGGASCIALYSFEEVGQGKFAPKTISFTLFSTTNPKPVVEDGQMKSVCDLKINGKTIARYGKTCVDKDQPLGDYEIKFGWGIQRSDLYDIRESMTFTVTEKQFVPQPVKQDEDELVISQFEEGLISEKEFEERLFELGYDPEEIRQAKSIIGKLEHQEGFQAPLKKPVRVQGTDFDLTYGISGGVVKQVTPYPDSQSLIIEIDSVSTGILSVKLPRDVIDAKFGEEDDEFFVLLDGLETSFDETKTGNERTLTIEYPAGTEEIEIIGTFVIPEFGTIAALILFLAAIPLIVLSRAKMSLPMKF